MISLNTVLWAVDVVLLYRLNATSSTTINPTAVIFGLWWLTCMLGMFGAFEYAAR